MYRLIVTLALVILSGLATYLLIQEAPYLLIFGFSIIPIFLARYVSNFRFSMSLCLVALSFAFLFFVLSPKDWPWLLTSILGFNLAIPLAHQLIKIEKWYRDLWKEKLGEAQRPYKKLKDEERKVIAINTRLDQDVTEIADLYQVTREMGESLGFSEIFAILGGVLRKTFDFERSKLLLIDESKRPVGIEKVLQIQKERASLVNELPVQNFDRRLIKVLGEERGPIIISPIESLPQGVNLVLPSAVKSLIAAPLIIEDRIIAVLTMEDFKGEVYDKFLILAGQLALEIRKVRLYEAIQEMAIMDGLTKAYVRRHFLERFDEELARSKRHRLKLSFFMVDIDHFKRYNDKYGHLVGDSALQEVAEILKNSVRRVDLVCRYGGEEFALILPQTDKEGGLQVAERIRWAAENHSFKAYDKISKVTVSIGVATFPDDANQMGELIERADKAMYRAKQLGRNRVVAYKRRRG